MVDRLFTDSKIYKQLLTAGGQAPLRGAATGDSITANSGGSRAGPNNVTWNNNGYPAWVKIHSQGRIDFPAGYIKATGGFTSAQVLATHIPAILALDPKPDFCIVYVGTNISGALKDNVASMIKQLSEAGILPVVMAVQLTSSDLSARRPQYDYNQWLRDLSRGSPTLRTQYGLTSQHQFLFVDPSRYFSDFASATGGVQPGLLSDGLHPGAAGAYYLGFEIWRILKQSLQLFDMPMMGDYGDTWTSTTPLGNLITGNTSHMLGTGGTLTADVFTGNTRVNNGLTSGLAYNRQSGNSTCTTTFSKIPKIDGYTGERQQIAITGTTRAATSPQAFDHHRFLGTIPAASLTVGDWYYTEVDYEVIGTPIGLRSIHLSFDGSVFNGDTGSNLAQVPHRGTLRTSPSQVQSAVNKTPAFNVYTDTTVDGATVTVAIDRWRAQKCGGPLG